MRLTLLFACVVSLSACSEGLTTTDDPLVEPDLSGSLQVPLTAEGEPDTTYRLRDVDLDVTGAALLTLSDRDDLRARESLVAALPAGDYTVYLRPGWRLMARDARGAEQPVQAELVSRNPVTVHVDAMGHEQLKLVMRRGGQELRFGVPIRERVTRVELAQRSASTTLL
jgi:hypothetical protein